MRKSSNIPRSVNRKAIRWGCNESRVSSTTATCFRTILQLFRRAFFCRLCREQSVQREGNARLLGPCDAASHNDICEAVWGFLLGFFLVFLQPKWSSHWEDDQLWCSDWRTTQDLYVFKRECLAFLGKSDLSLHFCGTSPVRPKPKPVPTPQQKAKQLCSFDIMNSHI